MRRVLRISEAGFSECPGCGRFIRLLDDIAKTRCDFCGSMILDAPEGPATGTLPFYATLPGRSGAMAAALAAYSTGAGEGLPLRDPQLDGDTAKLRRGRISKAEADGARPGLAVWEITLACDLKCVHCGSRAGRRRPEELSTRECLDVVHQLARLGVGEVVLIGGETYMRRDWDVIAREIGRCGMACTIATGGRSFDERRLAAAVDAGVCSIGVSIDGIQQTHDELRGVPGAWEQAVGACERIAASPIRLTTNTQINARSMPELPAIARLMVELGSAAWQLQLTVAMGRAADRPELLLQPYHLLELFPLLVWIREEVLDLNGIALAVGNNIGYFSPYEPAIRYGGRQGVHWSGCGAGASVLGIEADGTIKGCPSLATQDFAGGSSRHQTIAKIVRSAPEIRDISRRSRTDLRGFCRECYYGDVCTAGCTWTAHSLLGYTGDNPYCIHRAMTLEQQGLRERIAPHSPAPGLPFDRGEFRILTEEWDSTEAAIAVVGVPLEEVVRRGQNQSGKNSQRQTPGRHQLPSTARVRPDGAGLPP